MGGANKNTIYWTHPGGTGISYRVYYSAIPGVSSSDPYFSASASPYEHTGLNPGETVYYKIATYSLEYDYTSALSAEVSATTTNLRTDGRIIW